MPTAKLTKKAIEAAPVPVAGQLFLWDEDLKGFGVSVQASGVRSYVVRYRVRGSQRDRRMVIGRHGVLTVQEARKEALAVLADATRGVDTAAERRVEGRDLTIASLAEVYLDQHAARHHKDGGAQARRRFERDITPLVGKVGIEAASRSDMERVHGFISKRGPTHANRTIALLSGLFTFAESRGLRPQGANPCRFVRRNVENKRERYLTDDEIGAYFNGLSRAERESPRMARSCDALRLILFTGARKSEVLSLRWEFIDFQRNVAFLPDSKTGQRPLRLPEAAAKILRRIRKSARQSEWVFPGHRGVGHLSEIRKTHDRACEFARISDLRIHDLRHSFASVAVAGGHSISVIGKALGHARASTAERYAHLADDPVRHAVETTGAHLERLMNSDEPS
jgi:integrase